MTYRYRLQFYQCAKIGAAKNVGRLLFAKMAADEKIHKWENFCMKSHKLLAHFYLQYLFEKVFDKVTNKTYYNFKQRASHFDNRRRQAYAVLPALCFKHFQILLSVVAAKWNFYKNQNTRLFISQYTLTCDICAFC